MECKIWELQEKVVALKSSRGEFNEYSCEDALWLESLSIQEMEEILKS